MKKRGIIDARGDQYSTVERMHLIRCLANWSANLYIFGQLSWGQSITPLTEGDQAVFSQIANRCQEFGIELWAWMKPGDYRYIYNTSDRKQFVDNAKQYLKLGASGFYLLMDDLHPSADLTEKVLRKDAEYQALLITELDKALGSSFKAICGEHYHGAIPEDCRYYWEAILAVLPKHIMITWTGPQIWNRTLSAQDVPNLDWPLLLFDNYFASDSDDPARSPIYPYDGRNSDLLDAFEVAVINPNNRYPWQFCALQTAMSFWSAPEAYNPNAAFRQAVRDLGDMYLHDYSRFVERYVALDGGAVVTSRGRLSF